MKKIFLALITVSILTAAEISTKAAVYEASTLHNAVSRSETVQDLFFSRWQSIQDNQLYLDLYCKLNWVP